MMGMLDILTMRRIDSLKLMRMLAKLTMRGIHYQVDGDVGYEGNTLSS